jgi:hypothetical protein
MEEFKLFSNDEIVPQVSENVANRPKIDVLSSPTNMFYTYRYFIVAIVGFVGISVLLFHMVIKKVVGKTPEEMTAYLDDWIKRVWLPMKQWIGRILLRGYVKSDGAIHTTHIPENNSIHEFVKTLEINDSIQPI